MQKILFIFLLSMTVILVGAASAADNSFNSDVIKSFEPIVEKINAFFSKNPKLLTKVSSPDNPMQTAYSITHFQLNKISYDILTTNSIITPYEAHIDVDTELADNKPCGNQSVVKTEKEGWSNIDDAVKNADMKACFVIRTPQIGVIRHKFMFRYHIKTGSWSLSEIIYSDGSLNGRFMALLGVPSPWFPVINEPKALLFNNDWVQLLKGL